MSLGTTPTNSSLVQMLTTEFLKPFVGGRFESETKVAGKTPRTTTGTIIDISVTEGLLRLHLQIDFGGQLVLRPWVRDFHRAASTIEPDKLELANSDSKIRLFAPKAKG